MAKKRRGRSKGGKSSEWEWEDTGVELPAGRRYRFQRSGKKVKVLALVKKSKK